MNKKTILSALIISSVSVGAHAANADVDWFVGGGVGYQADNIKGEYTGGDDDATFQLRGGAIINENHRVMGTYAYMDELSQNTFLASYDYIHPVSEKFSVFAGASIGAADSEINNQSSTEFVWGGQAGMMYRINSNWSAELAYRYLDQDYQSHGVKINDTQQVYMSVDYRF
ncbi:outer membrane beta-barrel protein [Agarivorans albus]|uniref:Outer membrane protein H1 n=1 Tax=Agarivorans albus MKT 106 TaxID=1331007 RepID=R9PRD5_AGAAL|nr:outer membrane beta-barrel protein [Agarivorans albus]GAD03823.1 outer membrane protein H1 [Agarivorans albus MKT 106]